MNRQTQSILKLTTALQNTGAVSPTSQNPAASKVGFIADAALAEEQEQDGQSDKNRSGRKQSALEKYNIADHETPWHNIKE